MKRVLILLLAFAALLAGCGLAGEEGKLQTTNPLRESTAEGILQELGIGFSAPEDVEELQYFIIDTQDGSIAEMRFRRDNALCVCRVQAAEIPERGVPDISGMFFDWENDSTAMVGYNEALLNWNEGAEGVIRWYDYAPGLLYSVSVSADARMDRLVSLAEELYIPVQGDVEAISEEVNAPAELTNLLAAISQPYQFGVLGSSLRAAIYAGTMMDWFAENPVGEGEVSAAVVDFLSTLDTEELESFPEKLEYVETAAGELLGENGSELLSSCGYEPSHAPWDGEQIMAYFDMIWEIVGRSE